MSNTGPLSQTVSQSIKQSSNLQIHINIVKSDAKHPYLYKAMKQSTNTHKYC